MLHIDIHSFSYKKGGIPRDESGNGGGFTFDCRGILNPGRIEEYKSLTGNDPGVQEYLETKTEMPKFLELVKSIISINIDNYLERGFENLQINFGCTGGQHRSVHCAIKIAEYIKEKYPEGTEISLHHDEQHQLNLINNNR
ncbi:RapZ C-terminal domain-containing protein [Chryseobacterium gossypii]|uniref:RapZ C-terminal domain-containing protein n=1 Tax=Chryseobacterium gossypii TaxID=3231602 RepID=UPI003523DE22